MYIYILCLCHAKLQSFFRLFPRFSTMFPSCFSLDLASCRVATSCLNFSSKAKSLATGWPRNIHKLVELPIENEQKSWFSRQTMKLLGFWWCSGDLNLKMLDMTPKLQCFSRKIMIKQCIYKEFEWIGGLIMTYWGYKGIYSQLGLEIHTIYEQVDDCGVISQLYMG